MNKIGTISGIQAAFGGRWDDDKGGARLKSKFSDTLVYYDDKSIDAKSYPAPAIVHQMLEIEDARAAYVIYYHDDLGEIFGSIVFSAGNIAPLSETIYESSDGWEEAITRSSSDSNIDFIYLPEGVANLENEKHRAYETDKDKVFLKDLPKLSSSSNVGTILMVFVMLLILISIPIGAWIMIAKPFEKVEETQFRIEKIKPNFSAVLDQCSVDLEEPWPAPPEWTLRQEGCVIAPELARVTFPKPADQRPYAYRFYDLDAQQWDDFLSRASFMKMAERFPGQVLEGTNQFVLYMPYDVERDIVDDAYIPDTDPTTIIRQNFVGAVSISRGGAAAGIKGFTDLELDKTIDRLSGQRLTPNHVYRNMNSQQTGLEISSERIETRQVRIE